MPKSVLVEEFLLEPTSDEADAAEQAQNDSLNRALRKDVMLCTTWGIADAIEHVSGSVEAVVGCACVRVRVCVCVCVCVCVAGTGGGCG